MFKSLPTIIFLMICFSGFVFAQDINSAPEFGEVAELKNSKKVYIYADDLEMRKLILEELKKGSQLEVVGKIEEADFFIFYGTSFYSTGSTSFGGIFGNIIISSTATNTKEFADYYVIKKGDKIAEGKWRPRIIWGKQNKIVTRSNAFVKTKVPAKEETKKFLKELRDIK
jgi:hypothetical protein